jgi:hypothetical protein
VSDRIASEIASVRSDLDDLVEVFAELEDEVAILREHITEVIDHINGRAEAAS